jgi:hypothetical protein
VASSPPFRPALHPCYNAFLHRFKELLEPQ